MEAEEAFVGPLDPPIGVGDDHAGRGVPNHQRQASRLALRLLEALGCEVGPARPMGGATKHRTTCPWPSEHTHGLDDDSAVLIMEAGTWPSWKCLHSHHAHLGLFDLMEAAGVLR